MYGVVAKRLNCSNGKNTVLGKNTPFELVHTIAKPSVISFTISAAVFLLHSVPPLEPVAAVEVVTPGKFMKPLKPTESSPKKNVRSTKLSQA